jgi:hypothetical protein
MSIPVAWPQVLDFFGTPLVIEPSPGQQGVQVRPGDGPAERVIAAGVGRAAGGAVSSPSRHLAAGCGIVWHELRQLAWQNRWPRGPVATRLRSRGASAAWTTPWGLGPEAVVTGPRGQGARDSPRPESWPRPRQACPGSDRRRHPGPVGPLVRGAPKPRAGVRLCRATRGPTVGPLVGPLAGWPPAEEPDWPERTGQREDQTRRASQNLLAPGQRPRYDAANSPLRLFPGRVGLGRGRVPRADRSGWRVDQLDPRAPRAAACPARNHGCSRERPISHRPLAARTRPPDRGQPPGRRVRSFYFGELA